MSTATLDATAARAAWLEERRSGLGGSDMSAILGIDGSAFAVWASKTLPVEDDARPVNNRMRWGKRLERAIADEYAALTSRPVDFLGERVFRHPEHAWWIGSPDAGVGAVGADVAAVPYERGLEIKTSGLDQRWRFGDGADDVPERFIVQVAHYMPLLDVDVFDVHVLIGGNDDRIYTIQRDPQLEAVIAETGERWWKRHVEGNVPPPIDASPAVGEYLRRRFPRAVVDVREATAEEADILRRCQEAREAFAAAELRKDALENAVKAAIGEAGGIRLGEAKVTWPETKGRVQWERVARALGATDEVAEQHRGESTRRLMWPRKGL